MSRRVIGISEMIVTDNPQDLLVTYSLGSCIGVTMFDPQARVGGMIHYMLPASKIAPGKADARPAMFADTGIPLMLKQLYDMGARRDNLEVRVAGGSKLMDQNKVFNIGERNFLILRKIMWKNNLLIKAKDVGGTIARTLSLELSSGQVLVKTSAGVTEL